MAQIETTTKAKPNAKTTTIQWPYYREILAEKSALWADQYALTMAQALFADGKHTINTTFHSYIRTNPFGGEYLLTAGQNIIFEWMEKNWKFDEIDIAILREERIANPKTGEMERLYSAEFLDMLENSKFELTIEAMPEGEIAFPDEPIFRVNGPVWQCLMVEAGILNIQNSQSLFATLASRICNATKGEPVLEFGLRRAQTLGGLEPSRAAYVGGTAATSNMLAKKYYGIPTSGTMAHAYVMLHENELEAFKSYAKAMPHNGIFLVDTYDTVQGVKNAIQACKETGVLLKGIRLDSGDMGELSKQARELLDAYDMEHVDLYDWKGSKIAASNDLEENSITALKDDNAEIDTWGIGTNLVTARVQPALGGVYKLGAVFDYNQILTQDELDALKQGAREGKRIPDELNGYVRDVIKLSGDAIKVSIPGEMDVVRTFRTNKDGMLEFAGDIITDNMKCTPVNGGALSKTVRAINKNNVAENTLYAQGLQAYRPLVPVFDKGKRVVANETVHDARTRAQKQLARMHQTIKELTNPERYAVGLEESLYLKRQQTIINAAVPVMVG